MTASLRECIRTRRWITDTDSVALPGGAPTEAMALLADPVRMSREGTPRVPSGEWVVFVEFDPPAVEFDPPAWVEPTVKKLAELLTLPPGWDSYGALPVAQEHVNAMLRDLLLVMRDDTPVPSVAPTNRGGVQVEWHERGIDLEIETLSTHMLRVSFEDSATRTEWDREVSADLSSLIECIACLSSR